jgi:hypothetical protein
MTSALRKRREPEQDRNRDPDPDKGGCTAKGCAKKAKSDCQTTICKEKKDAAYLLMEKESGKPPERDCFTIDPNPAKCYNLISKDGRPFMSTKGSSLECECTVYRKKGCNRWGWVWFVPDDEHANYAQRPLNWEFEANSISCSLDSHDH